MTEHPLEWDLSLVYIDWDIHRDCEIIKNWEVYNEIE